MDLIVIDDGQKVPQLTPAQALMLQVDADVDVIFDQVIGNRCTEYDAAYSDALAFQAVGFSGAVPQSVQDWASIMNQTPTWAAQNVITQASAWNTVQAAMRKNRLATKQAARTAQTYEQIVAAQQAWDAFVVGIKQQLGIS
jgi:hypothetical protein